MFKIAIKQSNYEFDEVILKLTTFKFDGVA